MAWETVQRGLRVVEVPIIFVERAQGASKLNRSAIIESALLPWRLRRRHVPASR
jgi:dolichol-phosphate mannosyltransferase